MMDNLTAYDTWNEDHPGPTTEEVSTHVFDTFEEALHYYNQRKLMLKFAGTAGMYVTYPCKFSKDLK